ncbi:hypothetical protein P389DRAFT_210726 [Cystobasidium minutum MCA 4210]|uniref:uncharacterized protein n=1 Tax=Cystobasidium minutum MCA 4210 TaxID=1397322 RepID=UPI0034CE0F61|eukprot:jgi/Rhomi1/210726/estExt_Genemark1.C_4_t10294
MNTSRHRPQLSLDSSLSRAYNSAGGMNKSSSKLDEGLESGFTRVSMAQNPAKTGGFHWLDSTSIGSYDVVDSAGSLTDNDLAPVARHARSIDTGPLLDHTVTGGVTITLNLDRHIQYRAHAPATTGWNCRNCMPSTIRTSSGPNNILSLNPIRQKPQTETAKQMVAVPRSLMCFSLELRPSDDEGRDDFRESFQYVSLQLDFQIGSSAGLPRCQQSLSRSSKPSTSYSSFSNKAPAHAEASLLGLAIVRGFAPLALLSTNFLQYFGQTLYPSARETNAPEGPIVLGSGSQTGLYRDFEYRLARPHKPTVVGGDKLTARGCHAMASACPTPASSTLAQANIASPSTHIESAEYGTSSIRITVRSDPEAASSWRKRRLPFVILLEHPPDVPCIEARLELRTTTIHKGSGPDKRHIRTVSPESRRKASWLSVSDYEETDPGYASSSSRGNSISQQSHIENLHGGPISEASGPSFSDRPLDHFEQTVMIFPRRDPVSIISGGLGTVKDTLFQSGIAGRSRPSRPSGPDVPSRDGALQTRSTHAAGAPVKDKPLPAPPTDQVEQPPALPPPMPRSPAILNPIRSNSAHSAAATHHRIPRIPPPTLHRWQHASYSGPAGSKSSSGDSLRASEKSEEGSQKALRLERVPVPLISLPQEVPARPAPVRSSWATFAAPSAVEQTSHAHIDPPQLESIPIAQQERTDDELLDLVLTNWQDRLMDREPQNTLSECVPSHRQSR